MKFTDLHFPVQPLSLDLVRILFQEGFSWLKCFIAACSCRGQQAASKPCCGLLHQRILTSLLSSAIHTRCSAARCTTRWSFERRKRCTGAEFLSCDLTFAAPARARANTTKGAANETTCAQVLIF